MKYLAAFGAFWYDFLVGDSAVLAIGGVAAIALAYVFVAAGAAALAEMALPAAVIGTIVLSLRR